MVEPGKNRLPRNASLFLLVLLSLIASAVHFADNAFRPDLYPGPAWLTRKIILDAWLVVLASGYLAYRSGKCWALALYAALGFAGLAHYLGPHGSHIPLRCTFTVTAEAVTSAMLMVFALRRFRQAGSRFCDVESAT